MEGGRIAFGLAWAHCGWTQQFQYLRQKSGSRIRGLLTFGLGGLAGFKNFVGSSALDFSFFLKPHSIPASCPYLLLVRILLLKSSALSTISLDQQFSATFVLWHTEKALKLSRHTIDFLAVDMASASGRLMPHNGSTNKWPSHKLPWHTCRPFVAHHCAATQRFKTAAPDISVFEGQLHFLW